MQSGLDIFSQLQSALTGVRRDENQLSSALASATADLARLRAEEASSYRALAQVRLEALAHEGVAARLSSAERQALDILERRKDAAERDSRTRDHLLARSEELAARHADALRTIEDAAGAVDRQRAATQTRLKSDPNWQALDKANAEAEAIAKAAREKADRSASETAAKGKPYEDDSLFMYLWRRKYGTSAYKAGYFARWLDGKVANLIGYDELRPNYFMLNEIPARLKDHADRLAAVVRDKTLARASFERNALVADGIEPLEHMLSQREALAQSIALEQKNVEDDLRKLEAQTAETARGGNDPELKSALDAMSRALAQDDLMNLFQQAMQTATPEDEAIVRRLQRVKEDIETAERTVEQTRSAILDIERKRAELERSSERFQRQGYQDPFGGFSNGSIIGEVIGGILRGAMRGSDLDRTLDDGFSRQRPRSPGGFGGGIQFPNGEVWPRSRRMGHGWDDDILDRKDGGGSWWGGDSGTTVNPLPQDDGGFGGGGGFRTGGGF